VPTRLSLAVVAWRSRDVLRRCLTSLAENPPSGSWETVVVDNASGDGTVEMLAAEFPWVRVVANASNRGLSAANNQALLAATGDIVVISNPDIEFTAGALDALADVFDRRPRAGLVIPRMRQPDGELQVGAGDLPGLTEALLGRQWAARSQRAGFWWRDWPQDEERQVGHGNDACYAVRRTAVAAVGPQDESFPLDWEAIDWSARMRDADQEVWFCPAAEVVHLGGTSIAQARTRWVVQSHRGLYRYFAKRLGGLRRMLVAPLVALRALVKLGTVLAGVPVYRRAQRAARAGGDGVEPLSSPGANAAAAVPEASPPDRIGISLVLVTWRSRDAVLECLDALVAAPPRSPLEVVVVDNASGDGTVEAVRERHPWAHVVANPTNRGLAQANNQGLLLSRGSTVVISNPDVVFGPGALDALADFLGEHPAAAFVVPQVRLPDGALQSVAGDLPTLREALLGRIAQHARAKPGEAGGFCWDGWPHDTDARIGRAGDVTYAGRRHALVQIGLQDERFPLDWEGIDWSARARDLGWEVWFTPRACVTHQLGGSTGQAPRLWWIATTHRGMYRYFGKRAPAVTRPALAFLFTTRAIVKGSLVLARVPLHDWSRRSQRVVEPSVTANPG